MADVPLGKSTINNHEQRIAKLEEAVFAAKMPGTQAPVQGKVSKSKLEDMTKAEIFDYIDAEGLDVDKDQNKAELIDAVLAAVAG